jgi:hypothetical protein
LQRLLIFKDLALSQQRRRCWTTPALALILALKKSRPTHPIGVAACTLDCDSCGSNQS